MFHNITTIVRSSFRFTRRLWTAQQTSSICPEMNWTIRTKRSFGTFTMISLPLSSVSMNKLGHCKDYTIKKIQIMKLVKRFTSYSFYIFLVVYLFDTFFFILKRNLSHLFFSTLYLSI